MTAIETSLRDAPRQEAAPAQYMVVSPTADGGGAPLTPQQRFWLCAAGQVVGRVTLTETAADAQAILIPMANVKLGRNVAWNGSGDALIASRTGQIVVHGQSVAVEEFLELHTDLDAGAGTVEFQGDVFVRKNILDRATLTATGDVTVNGTVEAATLKVGGSLLVHHGICSKEMGRISARKNVQARFISNAHVAADGDVCVANEVANSRIICGGQFNGKSAIVLSSHITATRGIYCDAAGSSAGFRTILELGVAPADLELVKKTMAELGTLRQEAAAIRTKVEPLMKNPKHLSAQQKEKATELLYLADEADARANDLSKTLAPSHGRMNEAMLAEVRISGLLHPGVVLRCLGYEAIISSELRGPLRISLQTSGTTAQFVATDSHNQRMKILPATDTDQCQLIRQLRTVEN